MYPLGLLPFFCSFVPESVAVNAALVVPVLVLALWAYAILPRSSIHEDDDYPVHLPGFSLLHILPFFRRRFDFINQGFQLAGQAVYQFALLRNPVIVLSGEAARRDFFQARDLDLGAGFRFLSGAIPMLPGVTSDLGPQRVALIYKRLASAQTSESMSRLIPHILEDSRRTITAWGYSGILDPFERLSELIFQTSVRCIAFTELADDPATVKRLRELYDTLDTATTPATVLLPWLPGPSAVRRLVATKRIYDIINKAIDQRISSGIARDDTPQMLIDAGDERLVIVGVSSVFLFLRSSTLHALVFARDYSRAEHVLTLLVGRQFIMGLLVAGARSTGTTASWLFTFLSGHPDWKIKAAEEVQRLINRHATHPLPSSEPYKAAPSATEMSSSAQTHPARASLPLTSLTATLSNIPLSAWENETPILDALIRETLRVAEPHIAMRQYLPLTQSNGKNSYHETLYLGGKAIPPGAYVMYPFSDVHLSADVYKNPWRWDPGRTEMSLKAPYSYVGMGAGNNVCQGKRLAILEMKLITAQVVLGFSELRAVDKRGVPLAELPRPNWNDILTCRPPPGSCYVRFERTVEDAV